MRKYSVSTIAINGMIGAVYAVATILIAPIAYGQVQFRLSEILIFFAFYNKRYTVGLTVGCLIANYFSTAGSLPDMIFGTLATLIVCVLIGSTKKMWLVPIIAAVVNGIIVGAMLHYVLDLPLFATIGWVAFGEAVVVALGIPIFKALESNSKIREMLLND